MNKKKTVKWIVVAVTCVILLVLVVCPPLLIKKMAKESQKNPGQFSSTYLVGFDYSSYADVFGMAPVIFCQVRLDRSIDATYTWRNDKGEFLRETRNYKIPDDKFENIVFGVNPQEIYKLDPKVSDPKDVSDGGDAWLVVYGPDDEVLRECGGFAPTSERMNDIRRILFDNLPDELINDYNEFEENGGRF